MFTPEQMSDIDEQYIASHYPFILRDEIEELRIKLGSIIKQFNHCDYTNCFEYLVEAKDQMGLAILELDLK